MYEFRLPDIGEGVAEGEVVEWFVQEGQTVKEDAPLVSVLTDKANVEIPSPKTGKVVKLHAKVGEKVKVGAALVTLDEGGGGAPSQAEAPTAATPSPPPPSEPASTSAGAPAPSPGTNQGGRVLASPFVRRMAAERGIDLAAVRGSGPGGRVIESDLDVPKGTPKVGPASVAPEQSPAPTGGTPKPQPPSSAASAKAAAVSGDEERVPIRGVRRVIAEHMSEATHRAAHFTYVEEVDASELVRLRERMAKHVEKDGVRLSYLPFIIKAVVAGLSAHPWMNARMDDAAQELVVHHRHHIGIATAAPEGLVVPVVRDADHKSVGQLAREIQDLADRARAGKLHRDEMIGSTFTITSLGALGGVLATPILNYPEVAILGVHKIVRRPVFLPDGSVGGAHLMNLSVSLDHRVLDGIVGAQFLAEVKAHLEDPHRLFVELA